MAVYTRTTLENAVKDLTALPWGRNWALYCEAAKIGKVIWHGVFDRAEVENAPARVTVKETAHGPAFVRYKPFPAYWKAQNLEPVEHFEPGKDKGGAKDGKTEKAA